MLFTDRFAFVDLANELIAAGDAVGAACDRRKDGEWVVLLGGRKVSVEMLAPSRPIGAFVQAEHGINSFVSICFFNRLIL
jgi:hypothetical protein